MVHICSFMMVGIAAWEDIRKRSIYIMPLIFFTVIGVGFQIYINHFSWIFMLHGILPGIISALISKLGNDCIGMGDSLLLMSVGILEGSIFCVKLIGLACGGILIFSMFMMAVGKLHRKSQVACVPFLMLGYIGAWFI